MKKIVPDYMMVVSFLVLLSYGIWLLIYKYFLNLPEPINFLLPNIVSWLIAVLSYYLFENFGWRLLRLIPWVKEIPILYKFYQGNIRFNDEEYKILLKVKQTYFDRKISFKSITKEKVANKKEGEDQTDFEIYSDAEGMKHTVKFEIPSNIFYENNLKDPYYLTMVFNNENEKIIYSRSELREGLLKSPESLTLKEYEEPTTKKIIEELFLDTWDESCIHLNSLMYTTNYDEFANRKENVKTEKKGENDTVGFNFDEDLYVPSPIDSEAIEQFLNSSRKTGIILKGESGNGKTNLLIKHFLKKRREGNITIFVSASQLKDTNIYEYYKNIIKKFSLKHEFFIDEIELEKRIVKTRREIIIFIDAINEYHKEEGAQELLNNIIELITLKKGNKNIKFICSTRRELWDQYFNANDRKRELLQMDVFHTDNGMPITIKGFTTEESKVELYGKYQKKYNLDPVEYSDLDENIKDIIIQPFMMQMVAEAFQNKPNQKKFKIPGKGTNFYLIFEKAAKKRIELTKVAYPNNKQLGVEMEACLINFAHLLYQKITSESYSIKDIEASITQEKLTEDINFTNYFNEKKELKEDSILYILIDDGFIDAVKYETTDDSIGLDIVTNKKYKFRYEQSTQYWLSQVLYNIILRNVLQNEIKDEKIGEIKKIISKAQNAPVLTGAMDHWFYRNMSIEKPDGNTNYQLDAFSKLLENNENQNEGIFIYYVGSFFQSLIDKNIVKQERLFNEIFSGTNDALKKCITNHLLDLIRYRINQITKDSGYISKFCNLIENCDVEKDHEIIRQIGDTYSEISKNNLKYSILFLKNIYTSKTIKNLIGTDQKYSEKHIAFLVNFLTKSIISLKENERSKFLTKFLFHFIWTIFHITIWINIKRRSKLIKNNMKKKIHKAIDKTGEDHWRQAIGNRKTGRNINNKFYVEEFGEKNALLQRDVLKELFPYLIDLHNHKINVETFKGNRDFKELIIKAISFHESSLIGYVAVIILGVIINEVKVKKKECFYDIINEITKDKTKSTISLAAILIDNLTKTKETKKDKDFSRYLLKTTKDKIIPLLIKLETERLDQNKDGNPINLYTFIDTPGIDITIDEEWDEFKSIFEMIFEEIKDTDKDRINKLTNKLCYVCFLPNVEIGKKVIGHIIKSKGDKQNWRDTIVKLLAAMWARDEKIFKDLMNNTEYSKFEYLNETNIRQYRVNNIVELRDARSYQTNWNESFISAFSENKYERYRYYLIRDLFGGLVTTNNVKDMATEYRRFALHTVLSNLPFTRYRYRRNSELTLEETLKLFKERDKSNKPGEPYLE